MEDLLCKRHHKVLETRLEDLKLNFWVKSMQFRGSAPGRVFLAF